MATVNDNNITRQQITDTLEQNYMPYAMSVIVSRAIPEIDGFKPAHRKLLYTMFGMGLLTGERVKSADVVGQTMRLNPHGDGAIYETLVRLTRGNDALLHPFVDSKGNFGKHYSRDMAYAASRYTEVRLDSVCREVFRDIDKDTVDFMDNYNGSMKEPALLPVTFPNILVSANQGIAVGMASTICGFNLKEVCAAAAAHIKDPGCDLLKLLKAPDFTGGGELLYDAEEMDAIYKTGRGSFKVRAKYRYDKKQSCVEVYEIPYTTTVEAIIDKIAALVKAGKVREVNDVRDETDLNGLKIAIDIKRSADPDALMRRLFSLTTLCDSFNCNFNVLVGGKPRLMGVGELLGEWAAFRRECVRRQCLYDIKKKSEKLHLLEGLSAIILDIDRAIAIIRKTEDDDLVIPNLMAGFGIDELQADFVAEIKLRNLNKAHLMNKLEELSGLRADIESLQATADSDERINDVICGQLKDIAKRYGAPRRTAIAAKDDMPDAQEDEFVPDYGVKLFLTGQNYFKKIPLNSLRMSGDQYLKDGDAVALELETTNKADIVFFSSRCCAYKAKACDMADCKASGIGVYLNNALGLEADEKILTMAATTDYSGFVLFVFENGKMAKVPMESYATKVNRRKLVNACSSKSPVVFAHHLPEDTDIFAFRDSDKAMLINTALIPAMSTRNSSGVQVFTLKRNSVLGGAALASGPADNPPKDPEHYRVKKIPSSGHFIVKNDFSK